MQEGFGGLLNLTLIVIFLVIVSGVLALTVSYTKAFKMKNIVIESVEEFRGGKNCFDSGSYKSFDSFCKGSKKKKLSCSSAIMNNACDIGYSPAKLSCPKKYTKVNNQFCYKKNNNNTYSIITQVDINIPIINNILGLTFFQVSGDTNVIKK